METLQSTAELRSWRQSQAQKSIAFVPTMGALHQGHLSLVAAARTKAEQCVASIFINPIQFGPNEDFERYPRTVEADLALLAESGVAAVFLPTAASMYPPGFQTYVTNRDMAGILCGKKRTGHFDGVLTVVLKLLNILQPEVAIFGKKDFQQWRLIAQMAQDLELSTAIIGAPIVREDDGLAMSSRNRYLGPNERRQAAQIYRALQAAQADYRSGERSTTRLLGSFQACLSAVPAIELEYSELLRAQDLKAPTGSVDEALVLLTACHLGGVRLLDNLELES